MQTKIQKWGNSLALRIPKSFAMNIGIKNDDFVNLEIKDGRLIISMVCEDEYFLEDLLNGITKENLHSEISAGDPVGKEIF